MSNRSNEAASNFLIIVVKQVIILSKYNTFLSIVYPLYINIVITTNRSRNINIEVILITSE